MSSKHLCKSRLAAAYITCYCNMHIKYYYFSLSHKPRNRFDSFFWGRKIKAVSQHYSAKITKPFLIFVCFNEFLNDKD
jgi:hypothetical protein